MQYELIALLTIIVLAEAAAQSNANLFAHNGELIYYLIGVLFYAMVVFSLSMSHKHVGMGVINCIWSGLSIIAIAITGYVFFNQQLHVKQWLALLGTAALVSYLSHTIDEIAP